MRYLLFLFLALPLWANTIQTPNEFKRYHLIHDRILVDKFYKKERYQSFIDLDITASSGIKELLNDFKLANQDDPSWSSLPESTKKSLKQVKILALMNKYINNEKYLEIDLTLGLPLPSFHLGGYNHLPSLFLNENLSTIFSFSNETGINPIGQLFAKNDLKYGLIHKVKYKNLLSTLRLYSLQRIDVRSSVTQTDIVEDGELLNMDDLKGTDTYYALDLGFNYFLHQKEFVFLMEELKFLHQSGEKEDDYSQIPFFLVAYKQTYPFERFDLKMSYGLHQREYYSLIDGLFVGTDLKFKSTPVILHGHIDNHFLTFMPRLSMKFFNFSYTLKTPYRNPIDGVWVSSIHSLEIGSEF